MEFPAFPLDKLEPLHASLKAFLSNITYLERKKARSLVQWASDPVDKWCITAIH